MRRPDGTHLPENLVEGRKLVTEGPLRLSLAEGLLRLAPGRLLVDGDALPVAHFWPTSLGGAPDGPAFSWLLDHPDEVEISDPDVRFKVTDAAERPIEGTP